MSFETRDNISSAPKKIKIGSRVPEENREWLKRHGIIDEALNLPRLRLKISPPFWFWRTFVAVVLAAATCALAVGWFQDRKDLTAQVHDERQRQNILTTSNYHLRGAVSRLSAINLFQQSEINRLGDQIQQMTEAFRAQIQNFQKNEAMSDALGHTFESEMDRMSGRYDMTIQGLRRQVMNLESSLETVEGVVVRADPVTGGTGMTNASIAAINQDFQFVVVDAGELQGARAGQIVEFYQQGTLIGYGEVEKVYPEYSGVKVYSLNVMGQLQTGDAVFLKSSWNRAQS